MLYAIQDASHFTITHADSRVVAQAEAYRLATTECRNVSVFNLDTDEYTDNVDSLGTLTILEKEWSIY